MPATPIAATLIAFALIVPALISTPASAFEDHARVQVMDGGDLDVANPEGGTARLAGIEIVLDPGWKTYWRHPGDSGIPPTFDFSGSRNVAGVSVEWPSPKIESDGYGKIIGYTGTVVLPLVVRVEDPAAPAHLSLSMHYGVCKDICIPAEAEIEATLDGSAPRTATVAFHRRHVPVSVEPGDPRGGVDGISLDGGTMTITARFPEGARDAFVVLEGPPDWHLPVPEPAGTDSRGRYLFTVPLDGLPHGATTADTRVTVTGVSPRFSFEQALTLD